MSNPVGQQDVAGSVSLSRSNEGAGHMTPGASVTLKLKDGRVLTKRVVYFKGTPQNPANRDDVHEKFSLLTRHCPKGKMDEIFDRLQNIENEKNFDWLKV